MHFNLKLTVLALCCTVALADLTTRQQVEMNVMNLLMQTRAQSRDNPSRSIGCVDYYIPKLQDATNEYDRSLRQCETDRKNAIEGVESSRQDELLTIAVSAEDSCSKLRTCSEEASSSKAFECYSSSGADGQKALYGISKDSSALLKELEEEKQAIEGEKVKCTNTCDRTYTEESQRLNAAMTDCILGLEEVPTEPSTETPTDPTTTTDAPTDAPPTTEATNEPTTTTEVVTEGPTTGETTDEPSPTTEVVTEGPTTGATSEVVTDEPNTTTEVVTDEPSPTTTEVVTDEPTSGAPSEPTAEPPTETESGESGSSGEPESNESKSPEEDLRRRARVMFASYIPRS